VTPGQERNPLPRGALVISSAVRPVSKVTQPTPILACVSGVCRVFMEVIEGAFRELPDDTTVRPITVAEAALGDDVDTFVTWCHSHGLMVRRVGGGPEVIKILLCRSELDMEGNPIERPT
jgi:hypothetical protein